MNACSGQADSSQDEGTLRPQLPRTPPPLAREEQKESARLPTPTPLGPASMSPSS